MDRLISSLPRDDEIYDLRLVLSAGGVSALALGMVALVAERTGALALPAPQSVLLAILGGVVTLAGWIALLTRKRTHHIAWALLVAYMLLITAAIHYTGGPQTPMPALYLLVVVAAAFVLGPRGALSIAGASVAAYGILLALEYTGILPTYSIWQIPFDVHGKGVLLAVNWLAVAIPALLTAFICGSLAQRIKMRNQELSASERSRKEMVESLVHDLRNPLTVLLGTLELINMVLGQTLDDEQRGLIDSARRSGHSLLVMIGDMLDVAKLEEGQLTLKPQLLDTAALLREAMEQFRVYAELAGMSLEFKVNGPLPRVEADPQLIQRVIANLVSNAIRHTPAGGRITLSTSVSRDKSFGSVAVSVSDTGEGIPLDQQARIFERFGQVEQDGFERRGTGLGLTFCKMAVEAHHGRIWVESTPGKGSTFTFLLPVALEHMQF